MTITTFFATLISLFAFAPDLNLVVVTVLSIAAASVAYKAFPQSVR